MFQVGQKVVCINGDFPKPLARLYKNFPVKDQVYTIRAVYVGRGVAFPSKPGQSDGEIGVLLNEIVNPPDLKMVRGHELGFKAERFAPVEEIPPAEETNETAVERELVHI